MDSFAINNVRRHRARPGGATTGRLETQPPPAAATGLAPVERRLGGSPSGQVVVPPGQARRRRRGWGNRRAVLAGQSWLHRGKPGGGRLPQPRPPVPAIAGRVQYAPTYDADNRVATVKDMFGVTLTFGYDAAGNRTLEQDSFGGVVTSVYNADNQLQTREMTADGSTARMDFTYNSRSEVATEIASSNLTGTMVLAQATYTYDTTGRLSNLQQTGNSTLFDNYTYTYDNADRATSVTLNSTTTSYGYDATNELTSAGTYVYSYDTNGNRTMTGTGNELTNDGVNTYTFDSNGNVTEQSMGPSATTWYYTYNDINQMVSAKEYTKATGGTLLQQGTYVYDVFGNLIEEDVNNGTSTTVSRYVRDGWNPDKPSPIGDENYDIYATVSSSNALVTTYMQGDATAQALSRISVAGTAAWYSQDRLGSDNFILDSSGNVLDQRTYDAYGVLLAETAPTSGDQFGYAGIYTDPLTSRELDARSYKPWDGVYDQRDPADATPNNLYGYTDDDSTNATDPSGLDPIKSIDQTAITEGTLR